MNFVGYNLDRLWGEKVKRSFLLFMALGIILLFQNCGSYKATDESNSNLSSTVKLTGEELYGIHCASCHQPLAQSSKKPRSASQISNAIKGIEQMKEMPSLMSLSAQQIALISEALSLVVEPPDDGDGGKPEVVFQQPLGNRKFVASKLKSLFSGGNATINTNIDNWTTNLVGIFASPCNATVPECRGDQAQNMMAPGIATSNVLRSGYRIKICESVLENDIAVSNMLSQVGLTSASARSKGNVVAVSMAMTNVAVSDAVYADFQDIDTRLNGNALEGWRMILLTLCKSNLFENF